MTKYILKRLLLALLTVWVIVTITFILMHSIPGDPFADEKNIPPAILNNLYAKYGLDKPLYEQYAIYFGNLLRGDFGISYKYTGRSVNDMISQGFPVSMSLGLTAGVFGIGVGVLFGILSSVNRGKWPDYLVIIIAILGVSIPAFVFASLFQYLFGARLKLLPVSGWKGPVYMILPMLALGLRMISHIARMMRASMLDVLGQDYIKAARAKGLGERRIITRHTLRNAITPVVTVMGVMVASTVVGSFVVETVFTIPGMGTHLINAVKASDYTVVLGLTTFYALIMVAVMLVVDLVYVLIDPRIRLD